MPSVELATPPPSVLGGHEKARPRATQPLTYSGSLDSYEHNDLTPSVVSQIEVFLGISISDIGNASAA